MTSMRYGPVQLSSPPGFQNILRLISQEVLRVQPKDTLSFIAAFVKDILEIRENTGYDPVMQGDMIERIKEQYHQLRYEREEHRIVEAEPDQAPADKTQAEVPTASQQETTQANDAVSQTPTAELATSPVKTPRSEAPAENLATDGEPEQQVVEEPAREPAEVVEETADENQGVQDMDDGGDKEETTAEEANETAQDDSTAVEPTVEPATGEEPTED